MTVWSSYGVGAVHAGEGYLTLLPKNYRADGSLRGVIYCHGAGDAAFSGSLNEGTVPSVRNIVLTVASRLPVLSCDLGGQHTWGNDTSLARLTEAKAYLQGALGAKSGPVALLALSMGHLTAMNWAAQNLSDVACVAGIIPCCDLDDIYSNDRGGFATFIDGAYGGVYVPEAEQAVHNPATIAAAGGFAGLRHKTWYGAGDTVALASTATALSAAIGGTSSAVQAATTGHVDATVAAIPADDVLDFLTLHA
jgi:hypothetical protein